MLQESNTCFEGSSKFQYEDFFLEDLSFSDARSYYQYHVQQYVPNDQKLLFKEELCTFDEVFNMTGGSISNIKVFVDQVVAAGALPSGLQQANLCSVTLCMINEGFEFCSLTASVLMFHAHFSCFFDDMVWACVVFMPRPQPFLLY